MGMGILAPVTPKLVLELSGAWIVATCIPLTTLGFMAGPALAGMLSVRIVAGAPFVLSAALAVLGILCIQRGSSADRRDHLIQPA